MFLVACFACVWFVPFFQNKLLGCLEVSVGDSLSLIVVLGIDPSEHTWRGDGSEWMVLFPQRCRIFMGRESF